MAELKPWKNLTICQVDDPVTFWVKKAAEEEGPEHHQFLTFEQQLNDHYSKGQDFPNSCVDPLKLGRCIFKHKGFWFRGIIQKLRSSICSKYATILRVDYGDLVEVETDHVVGVKADEWSGIPYRLKQVRLKSICPASLCYEFDSGELRMIVKRSSSWDVSAEVFVAHLVASLTGCEFYPHHTQEDGTSIGHLKLCMGKDAMVRVPELSRFCRLDLSELVDLGQLLLSGGYALVEDIEQASPERAIDNGKQVEKGMKAQKELSVSLPALDGKTCPVSFASTVSMVPKGDVTAFHCNNGRGLAYFSSISSLLSPSSSSLQSLPSAEGDENLSPGRLPATATVAASDKLNSSFTAIPDPVEYRKHHTPSHGLLSKSSYKDLKQSDVWDGTCISEADTSITHRQDTVKVVKADDLEISSVNSTARYVDRGEERNKKDSDEPYLPQENFQSSLQSYPEELHTKENTSFNYNTEIPLSSYCIDDISDDEILKDEVISSSRNEAKTETELARLLRVFFSGERLPDIAVNRDILKIYLNPSVLSYIEKKHLKILRIQAYTWPSLMTGRSSVIVGEKRSGKTMGYVIPLISVLLDMEQRIHMQLPKEIGPIAIIICNSWQKVQETCDMFSEFLATKTGCYLKVLPVWGGMSEKEVDNMENKILSDCDVLITTLPCLIRLLSGDGINHKKSTTDKVKLSVVRFCYAIIDDAECIIPQFAENIKCLLHLFGECCSNKGRIHLPLQITMVCQKWTCLVGEFVQLLMPVFHPSVIISSPTQAAVIAQVKTIVHYVPNDRKASLEKAIDIFRSSELLFKAVVFVDEYQDAKILASFLTSLSMYVLIIKPDSMLWQFKQLVCEWHSAEKLVLIICEKSALQLLQLDIRNAQSLIHVHLPASASAFRQRYSLMLDMLILNNDAFSKCSSDIIINDSVLLNAPYIVSELENLNAAAPSSKILQASANATKPEVSLCYYFKAFGRCFRGNDCNWRHCIKKTDSPSCLPECGEILFKTVKVLSASRFFVHILKYRMNNTATWKDLRHLYIDLFRTVQKHCNNTLELKQLTFVRSEMLCLVRSSANWYRARIDSVQYQEKGTFVLLFLIDEGLMIKENCKNLFKIPSHLSSLPQLIVEVYLSSVEPVDKEWDWTPAATEFVDKLVSSDNGKKEMFGKIVLSLGWTLWLSPVVELLTIGREFIRTESLRSQLIANNFGCSNKEHIDVLMSHCHKAHLETPRETDYWLEKIQAAYDKLVFADDSGSFNTVVYKLNSKLHSSNSTLKQALESCTYYQEHLNLNEMLEVVIGEISSLDRFFIIKKDHLCRLHALDEEIHGYLQDKHGSSGDVFQESFCLARCTGGRYRRGWLEATEEEFCEVFFTDHGKRTSVGKSEVMPCPPAFLSLPAQAMMCSLAHVAFKEGKETEAVDALKSILADCSSWIAKALSYTETKQGRLYSIELLNKRVNPPLNVWQQLLQTNTVKREFAGVEEKVVLDRIASRSPQESNISNEDETESCQSRETQQQSTYDADNEFTIDTASEITSCTSAGKSVSSIPVPLLEAVNVSVPLNPETYWRQTKSSVFLSIRLPNVDSYECRIGSTSFRFKTVHSGKWYQISEAFYGEVDPDCSSIASKGLFVWVHLIKAKEGIWDKPFAVHKKIPWLHLEEPFYEDQDNDSNSSAADELGMMNNMSQHELPHIPCMPGGMSDYNSASCSTLYSDDSNVFSGLA